MNWVIVIWSMIESACLTLAMLNFLVWCYMHTARANLLFSLSAAATAALGFLELWAMRAETAGEFDMVLRWGHLPFWVLLVSLLGFVLFYMHAGRLWLAGTVCGLRTMSLILNFIFKPNINYQGITVLRHVRFLGESVSVIDGIPNPWMLLGQTGLLLFLVFLLDVTITLWRRGERRSLLILSGSMLFFITASMVQLVLSFWGILHGPITLSLFFLGVVAVMGAEMARETLQAAQLSADLHKNQEWLDLAADSAGVGLWMCDLKTNVIWATERARMLYGFSSDERILLDNFLSRLHPDDLDWVALALQKCCQAGADFRYDYRIVLPDGSIRLLRVLAKTFLMPAGAPQRITGVSIDITDFKQAEDSLRQSEERMKAITFSMADWVWEVDENGIYTYCSEKGDNILGHSREDIIGKTPYDFMPPDEARRVSAIFSEATADKASIKDLENWKIRKNGERICLLTNSVPILDKEGNFKGYRGVDRDISERLKAEAEDRQRRDELAHVSRIAMMGELTTSLAHEINQPLTAILSNAEAAQRFLSLAAPDISEVRQIMDDIIRDDRRASDVVRRVRALVKKEKSVNVHLDLNEVIQGCIDLIRGDFLLKGISIDTELISGLAMIHGDSIQLQQVLLNLILNGTDAMRNTAASQRRLIVRTVKPDDRTVKASVTDFGTGIDERFIDRLFEPFYTTKSEGLGMGLSISLAIIKTHGGTMEAWNNREGGATFAFTLPAHQRDLP